MFLDLALSPFDHRLDARPMFLEDGNLSLTSQTIANCPRLNFAPIIKARDEMCDVESLKYECMGDSSQIEDLLFFGNEVGVESRVLCPRVPWRLFSQASNDRRRE